GPAQDPIGRGVRVDDPPLGRGDRDAVRERVQHRAEIDAGEIEREVCGHGPGKGWGVRSGYGVRGYCAGDSAGKPGAARMGFGIRPTREPSSVKWTCRT